jgi:hypothetical protein
MFLNLITNVGTFGLPINKTKAMEALKILLVRRIDKDWSMDVHSKGQLDAVTVPIDINVAYKLIGLQGAKELKGEGEYSNKSVWYLF